MNTSGVAVLDQTPQYIRMVDNYKVEVSQAGINWTTIAIVNPAPEAFISVSTEDIRFKPE